MEGQVKRSFKLEDGVHNGTIKGLEERKDPYEYLDICIELPDCRILKAAFPNNIQIESKLGRLLTRFGAKLVEGSILQLDPILVGKSCTFQSITEQKGDKSYAKIIGESLKPKNIVPTEQV